MITTLQELLTLPQDKKDALLIMAIDRMATKHRIQGDEIRNIERMTAGNYAHNVAYIKQNLNAAEHMAVEFSKQAGIDLDALAKADDFHYVLDMFNIRFPYEKEI